jgi:transposase-like protein
MPSKKKSNQPRVPIPHRNVQVNFCKNMDCGHFGAEPSVVRQKPGTPTTDGYVVGSKDGQRVRLICKSCRQYTILKNNQSVHAEYARIASYLVSDDSVGSCPNRDCPNHRTDVSVGKYLYRKNGTTSARSQIYQCKVCDKKFSVPAKSTSRQRIPHKNKSIFMAILNKVPFKRICEIEEIQMKTIYTKIDFFHRQCLAFVGHRERQLLDKVNLERAYIATDRQEYIVNWTKTNDKRNIILKAIASAEMKSGYVFGMHANFDPYLDHQEVMDALIENDRDTIDPPFRAFARAWMPTEYLGKPRKREPFDEPTPLGALEEAIKNRYQETLKRPNIEASDDPDESARLPYRGLQIHEDYTMYGHFLFLKKLLANVGKIRFFMDQDSGIRAACLSAFKEEVQRGACDAFYVAINKDLNIHEKLKLCGGQKQRMEEKQFLYPYLSEKSIRLLGIAEEMKRLKTIGSWKDRWLKYPFPSKSEPEKAVCYLTNRDDYDEMHLANLYHMASLKPVDSYFNQVRTRISCLQHSLVSASNTGRRWFGYQPYNPALVQKLLDIFRVYYNYSLKSKIDKQTPAMRLGLAKGPIGVEDILRFNP